MTDPEKASEQVGQFVERVIASCDLRVEFVCRSQQGSSPSIRGEFTGPDAPMLTARNGELLNAIESLAGAILRLQPEEHDLISFDALQFKSKRIELLRREARSAIRTVERTGRPYAFPPMNSRERRMLHLELADSGLRTASSDEGGRRYVVLYPRGSASDVESGKRADEIRSAFRPRYWLQVSGRSAGAAKHLGGYYSMDRAS